jgi:hypothetical protein
MKEKQVKIRKIHLDTLMKVLVELYDKGVDYIDIIGIENKDQDSIGVSFCSEYMNEDMKENFDKIPAPQIDIESRPISDEDDLNQLI